MKWWRVFNEWLAVHVTTSVSTMACVWIFFVWSMLPLVFDGLRDMVFYVSGGILQLVLLPVIMVGQAKLSAASDIRAIQDHAALIELVNALHDKHDELHDKVEELSR
jgi:hypothetical protein